MSQPKMRTLGLLGGMTFHATALYYSQINDHVQEQLGGNHSARMVLHSFDYDDICGHFLAGNNAEVSRQLCTAATSLKSIGAEAIVLCVNTCHMWADDVERATGIPLLHIIDFTAEAIHRAGLNKVALLATKATLEGTFIKGRLEQKHGLGVVVPPAEEGLRDGMDAAIFGDLPKHIVTPETKKMFVDAARDLVAQGAEGIILGCTELQFVFEAGDVDVPVFDTVALHARGAAQWALDR